MYPAAGQRLGAALLALGIGFLLFRTILLMAGGTLTLYMPWVASLLVLEFAVDGATVGFSVRWWLTRSEKHASLPLRLAAAAVVLHAVRVAVFAVGRLGPWVGFDFRPEYRLIHGEPSDATLVYPVVTLALLGVLGVVVIWRYRRRLRARLD